MKKRPVRVTHLSNGIRVVTERIPYGRSVSIGVWVQCGSVCETQQNNGIAHFMEHMFFKGTQRRTAREIAYSLESLGGSLNASTGKELSVYTALVLDEYMPQAVDVLFDIVQNPLFADADIAREKKVVLTEINHAREDPEEMALDYLYMNLFPEHPLGYLIYGTDKNVKKFTRQNLVDFHQQFYRPERMIIAAAGQVDHGNFVAEIEKRFAPGLARDYHQVPHESPNAWPAGIPTAKYVQDSSQQAHLCTGFRIFSYADPRRYPLVLLDMLFGGGMSSWLFQNIREKYGFAYSLYSFVDLMAQTGVFGTYMACDARRTAAALELLQQEFTRLRRKGISQHELDIVKKQAHGHIILGLEGSSRRMHKIAEAEIYHAEHVMPEEVARRVERVTTTQISELVEAFMDPAQQVTTVVAPQ